MDAIDRRGFLRAAAAAGLIPLPSVLGGLEKLDGPMARVLAELGDSPLPPSPGDYPLRPVRFDRVDIRDTFWRPLMEVNRDVSLGYCFERFQPEEEFHFSKLIEAAGYMMRERPDPALEEEVDRHASALLAGIGSRIRRPEDSVRVSGHFLEAGVEYARATGKRSVLEAATELADQMDAVYGPGKASYISGHEGLKIGLVALYRATGDERFWRLAKFFADQRGLEDYPREGRQARHPEHNQDHAPVVEQKEAVGHCVCATFLYIAMTDLAALTGDEAYLNAVHRIWEDQTWHKTYVTGGIGSVRWHEKYGDAYELPNFSSWHETCASYGNAVWNHRLALLNRDARYADLMERILYNSILLGVSLEGDRFFYQNTLKDFGDYRRFEWINVACCPPNVIRMVASIGDYVYATEASTGGLYANLFVESDALVEAGGVPVRVRQETRYPWDGAVRFRVDPEGGTSSFPLHLRIPGWARNEAWQGELYRFVDEDGDRPTLRVNGAPIPLEIERGYAALERTWRPGDVVELDLPMPVRQVLTHDAVRDNRGRVALQRGPMVYCAEWPDNDGRVHNIVVPEGAGFDSEFRPDLLEGVQVVTGEVEAIQRDSRGETAPTTPHQLTAIPYYAWANRGMGEMAVWMAREPGTAWLPPSLPEPIARVTTSGGVEKVWTGYNDSHDALSSIHDGREPLNSADASYRFFRMRPPKGERAWLVYEFDTPTELSSSRTYFFADKRFCTLPDYWRLFYMEGDSWKPVEARNAYRVELDDWSEVEFYPVTTTAVRLEVEPSTVYWRGGASGPPAAMPIDEDVEWREFGLIEWQVGKV